MVKSSPLGIYIKTGLGRIGKKQTWLAEEMDVSNNAVSKWIKTGKISRENFLDLIKILGPEGAPNLDFNPELAPDAAAILDFYLHQASDKERQLMQVMAGYRVEHLLSPSPDTKTLSTLAESVPHRPGEVRPDLSEEDLRRSLNDEKESPQKRA